MTHSELLQKFAEFKDAIPQTGGLKRTTVLQLLRDVADIESKVWADVLPEDTPTENNKRGY
jgi:hypothetical protein